MGHEGISERFARYLAEESDRGFGDIALRAEAAAKGIDWERAILATDDAMADLLPSLDVPTLILVGNQDILTPRGDSEELAERIPNAELVVISGAAHGLMVEHASTFNRLLLDFLARCSKAERAAANPSANGLLAVASAAS